jgi:hypothetical protein
MGSGTARILITLSLVAAGGAGLDASASTLLTTALTSMVELQPEDTTAPLGDGVPPPACASAHASQALPVPVCALDGAVDPIGAIDPLALRSALQTSGSVRQVPISVPDPVAYQRAKSGTEPPACDGESRSPAPARSARSALRVAR